MTELSILVPVLNRPHRVQPLLDSIHMTAHNAQVLFVCDHDDYAEIEAIGYAGGKYLVHTGSYAQKCNVAVRLTTTPLVFLGADDLTFLPGWFEAAKKRLTDGVQMVGVNDLIERRPERQGHATHFLMTREYAELPTLDGMRGPVHERYSHSFCDDELIATATKRGVYAYAEDSHVRHEHPIAGAAPDDETYRKGRARFHRDRRLFQRRSRLWA